MRSYKPTRKQRGFIRKWLERLRKPSSKQAKGVLKKGRGYCCLGHACAAFGKRFEITEDGDEICEEESGILPDSVAELIGTEASPYVFIGNGRFSLVGLNDDYKFSLKEIADVIEADWLKGRPLKEHKKIK